MSASIGDLIVAYANSKKHTKVGTGECYDLANEALTDAKAKTASDYGKITDDADYVWGTEVALAAVKPGDILQYRNYTLTISIETTTKLALPDGTKIDYSQSSSLTLTREHHTSIVSSSPVKGAVKVIEQNVDRGSGTTEKLVDSGEIYIASQPVRTSKTKQNVLIDFAWGETVKKLYKNLEHRKAIDEIVKKNRGKSFMADVTKTEGISVKGKLKAYRPQANSKQPVMSK